MNAKQREEEFTLQILEAIEASSDVTQRRLAGRMGIALGMANSYLKRCVRKGLVKMQQAPANRYLYYLTPQGFAEKSRLTADYLSYSFDFYRKAAQSCAEALEACRARGYQRLGFYGVSELAEIAALKAMDLGVELVCVCDPSGERSQFLNLKVFTHLENAPDVDAWLITDLVAPLQARAVLVERCGESCVFSPAVLGLDLAENPGSGLP